MAVGFTGNQHQKEMQPKNALILHTLYGKKINGF